MNNSQLSVEYYKQQWYVVALDWGIRSLVGGMWCLITVASILTAYKITNLTYREYRYQRILKQMNADIAVAPEYEDEINQMYKDRLKPYDDRLWRYKIRNSQDVYRYIFLGVIVLFLNIMWLQIEYMRSCMLYGIVLGALYYLWVWVDKALEPWWAERELQRERRQLDREIAKQKKQN